tara:strand:- start:6016 stop:6246 length:231 start_codon:yes stop_codon:yes gene_type:complete
MKVTNLIDESFNRMRHGSLYDRGAADSWYRRSSAPHWFPNGTSNPPLVDDLTEEQIEEYVAGYEDNEIFGDHKDWN